MFLAIALFAAATAAPAAPQMPDAAHVLAFLNRTVAWYDRLDAQATLADEPTDVLYVNDGRQLGRQIVSLSFAAAKAEAPLVPGTPQQAPTTMQQRLAKRATSAADQLKREQARLADLQHQLATANAADRPRLEAAVAEAQSRVAMAQARNDTVSGMVAFGSDGSGVPTDLPSQIAALEQTVAVNATAVPAIARKPPPSSVIGLIGDVIRLGQKKAAIESAIRAADVLQDDTRDFMAPLSAQLSRSRQAADALVNAPDTADPAEMLRRKSALDALSVQYRQLAAAMIPLAKRRILLDGYKASLGRGRSSVIDERYDDARGLIWRGAILGFLLLLVVTFAVVWRRVTFRYVHDVRRRHHFLLIRRIILLLLVAGILTATFASDFTSLTTFIGLLTAGIAIALQDVILSMAGYFVIIGKYGIRVGDRVRISTVNGDVLDVGLVWIYLMELEARGSDQLPTGRIVEFPNSVVFDHSAGIFKQLPGTRFLWHEVSLTVPASADFRGVQQRMLAAVESVFGEYAETIEKQHRDMDRLLGTSTANPRPHTRLRVVNDGIEIRVRYPVEIRNAGEIDDRVAAAITETAKQNVPRAVAR